MERQQNAPIQVVVGNPPWSAGQRSSADDNPNVDYPDLEKRIADTYAARSKATLKRGLYDTYKLAIRWASDRIGEQGVIALVTNGSWIDGNVDSGVRACLAEEFSSVWVLDLRGNARTSGERRRAEGDNVFGQGTRTPVAIMILVRKPAATRHGCRVFYRDVGDYLKREEKLGVLRETRSLAAVDQWCEIEPDEHHDWIGQRDPAFQRLYALGSKAAKAGKADDAVFRLFSSGYKTSRDAYTYNFSASDCAQNGNRMVADYMRAMELREASPDVPVEDAARLNSRNLRWDRELKNNLRRRRSVEYSLDRIRQTQYRPFVKQYCYVDYTLVNNKYQQDRIFPSGAVSGTGLAPSVRPSVRPSVELGDMRARRRLDEALEHPYHRRAARSGTGLEGSVLPPLPVRTENRVICVPGRGANKPFSVLVADRIPDLHYVEFGQCFPRWSFPSPRRRLRRAVSDGTGARGQHHRHGPARLPRPLRRQRHHEGRDLRLRLRRAARAGLSAALRERPDEGVAAYPVR
ncbi:MAG: hypothetical protein OXH70_01665 [Acidobacteria bacterium]|nr:hypothetical protein [Acidobacteriota bacterium]